MKIKWSSPKNCPVKTEHTIYSWVWVRDTLNRLAKSWTLGYLLQHFDAISLMFHLWPKKTCWALHSPPPFLYSPPTFKLPRIIKNCWNLEGTYSTIHKNILSDKSLECERGEWMRLSWQADRAPSRSTSFPAVSHNLDFIHAYTHMHMHVHAYTHSVFWKINISMSRSLFLFKK